MKLTKKAFREKLNQEDLEHRQYLESVGRNPDEAKHKNYQYGQRTRLYGDYLYAQDRDMFDWEYEEWVKQQNELQNE